MAGLKIDEWWVVMDKKGRIHESPWDGELYMDKIRKRLLDSKTEGDIEQGKLEICKIKIVRIET